MQIITISGFLSKDAEKRQTQSGDNVTSLNVPVRQGFGDKEQTNWFRVSVWGKRAEYAGKARKGDALFATGELTIGEYNGKPQYEVRASDFTVIRSEPKPDQREPDGSRGHADHGRQDSLADDLNDSIPFVTRDGIF